MAQITLATFNTDRNRNAGGQPGLLGKAIGLALGGRIKSGPYSVVQAVEFLDADVVHLQEVWDPDKKDDPENLLGDLEKLGYDVEFETFARFEDMSDVAPCPNFARTTGNVGIAIASRLPMWRSESIDLGSSPGDPIPTRSALAVTVEKDGETLTTICVHTSRFFPVLAFTHLNRLRKELPPPGAPFVVAGDCNFPRWATRATMRGFTSGAASNTWPSQKPLTQIDQLIYRPHDVSVSGIEVMRPGNSTSDHLALRANVAWGID